jgi:hypothetical protein
VGLRPPLEARVAAQIVEADRIAASIPCWRGSGPIARRCSSPIPSVMNSANPPSSSGMPMAA